MVRRYLRRPRECGGDILAAPHAHELRRHAGTRGALFRVQRYPLSGLGVAGTRFYVRVTQHLTFTTEYSVLPIYPRRTIYGTAAAMAIHQYQIFYSY